MPNMGTRTQAPGGAAHRGLADALFTTTQQRVLARIFGRPERSFYASELIALAGGGSGAVQRELARLARSGLVTVTRIGNQKHFQANPEAPIFAELCAIVQKTVGLVEPLRQALALHRDHIAAAFVFGSVAKRQDTASSDIDLMIVSDTLTHADIFLALEETATRLGRPVNPTVYSRKEFEKRVKRDNAFVKRVMSQPRVWVLGEERDLAIG
jgi:predicted nucleotidyltransferase